jgi:Mlc titration factor MtfA (ptsG expression regulator)
LKICATLDKALLPLHFSAAVMLLKSQRRKKLQAATFPSAWRQFLRNSVSLFQRLPSEDKTELEGHIQVFLAEKNFEGCAGLTLTDEIKLTIAAQACVLLLHRTTDYYPGLRSILVYPSVYYAPRQTHIGSGIMQETHESRLGQCVEGESIVLAWDAICGETEDSRAGHNVVLHEFAHQLDFEDGQADGAPLLAPGESFWRRGSSYRQWAKTFAAEFRQLRARVRAGKETVLDPYGATNPAEFFAVATETFFENPVTLRKDHLELYEQLKAYYQQDPALWAATV